MYSNDKPRFSLAVRELVDFSQRTGDLDYVTVYPNRGPEGIRVHQKIQKSRPDNYRCEIPISHTYETADIILEVGGRIDGVFCSSDEVIVEEIKTSYLDFDAIDGHKDPRHWGQVKTYACFYACDHDLEQIGLQLTYYHIPTQQSKEVRCLASYRELASFVAELVSTYLRWAERFSAWHLVRDASIGAMKFPFARYRTGQEEMAVTVYDTIKAGQQVFIQAPTGVGKTIACLYAAVKSLGEDSIKSVFFLTARTTGSFAAEQALRQLRSSGLRLKSLTITAKEKICFNPDKACNADECAYARGYYDRVNEAREEAFSYDCFTRNRISDLCQKHVLCPFEFTLELSRYVDCIICDYNYVFDPRVQLQHFFRNGRVDAVLLVDEAHNLVDRAREIYSAELCRRQVVRVRRLMRGKSKSVCTSIDRLNQLLLTMVKKCELSRPGYIEDRLNPELKGRIRQGVYAIQRYLIESKKTDYRDMLLEFYWTLIRLSAAMERYDDCYVTLYEMIGNDLRLKLFCLHPAGEVRDKLKRFRSIQFISGTLIQIAYYKDVLGCVHATETQLPSPFPPENLKIFIATNVSTRYRHRDRTKGRLCRLLQSFVQARKGNYILFFPSYTYMNMIYENFGDVMNDAKIIIQESGLTEYEKEAFLNRFSEQTDKSLVAFAVMGGIFGEGIDLAGDKLAGVAIVGVGLPGVSIERDLIRDFYDQADRRGYEYAYQYPGMTRVLQAAGRVIRSETDRGTVLLVDDRYHSSRYHTLLPSTWLPDLIHDEYMLQHKLQEFWLSGKANPGRLQETEVGAEYQTI